MVLGVHRHAADGASVALLALHEDVEGIATTVVCFVSRL
jgi:hypothetical protein